MYRMTSCDKWQDKWFSNLSPNAKLLFTFLTDNCDNAGFYEINERFLLMLTGLDKKQLSEAIKEIRKSYIKSNNPEAGVIWIKQFLKHQKKLPLNTNNNAHRQIILMLQRHLENKDTFQGCMEIDNLLPDADKPKKKKPKKSTPSRKNFVPPTLEEVKQDMIKKGFDRAESESENFINFYESKGWKVGNTKMKSWQHSVSNWIKNNAVKKQGSGVDSKPSKIDQLRESEAHAGDDIDWNVEYEKGKI